jgi:hypothetical protein
VATAVPRALAGELAPAAQLAPAVPPALAAQRAPAAPGQVAQLRPAARPGLEMAEGRQELRRATRPARAAAPAPTASAQEA